MYNEVTNTYTDKSGVEIKTSGFGETCKVEYLASNPVETSCTWQLPVGNYFHTFVDYFVDNRGYQRGKSIRAAPYDWRLAAGLCQLMNTMCVAACATSNWQLHVIYSECISGCRLKQMHDKHGVELHINALILLLN